MVLEDDASSSPPAQLLFSITTSLETETARIATMRAKCPKQAEFEMKRGACLVGLARDGRVDALKAALSRPTLRWFAVKMFIEAVRNNRKNVVDFMTDNGLRLDQPGLCDTLINLAQDSTATNRVEMTKNLVQQGHFIASYQRRSDWKTALHVACENGDFELADTLLDLGADVNAVAKDDVMPLNCAVDGKLANLLIQRGARNTWRRDT